MTWHKAEISIINAIARKAHRDAKRELRRRRIRRFFSRSAIPLLSTAGLGIFCFMAGYVAASNATLGLIIGTILMCVAIAERCDERQQTNRSTARQDGANNTKGTRK